MSQWQGRQVPVPWGVALRHLCQRQPGGTQKLVEAVRAEVGHGVGTRTTFMNLFKVSDPAVLGLVDLQRAWLLLAAAGVENPAADPWGVSDEVLPPAWYRDRAGIAGRIRHAVEQVDGDHSLLTA